jgi:predicted metalloprotease with PDZ domain
MDHVFVLYDRDSDSVWYPLGERTFDAVSGSRQGESIPFLDKPSPQPLADWLAAYPDSTILLPTEDDVRMLNRPYLGVSLEDGPEGLLIGEVVEGAPAETAGLRAADVIVSVDGHGIDERKDLFEAMSELNPGDVVDVIVRRDGSETTVPVTLGKRE